jgi:hypothetical protein
MVKGAGPAFRYIPSPWVPLEVFLESNRFPLGRLFERVHDLQAIDLAGVLHVF